MKVLVYSDLHLDHGPFNPILEDGIRVDDQADLVVLAGDINNGTSGIRWGRETFPDKPVVYVMGNHEFYGGHWDRTLDKARELAIEHDVHLLENDSFKLGEITFLGASLWTDFRLFGEDRFAAFAEARARMNDFKLIKISRSAEMYWVKSKHLIPDLTSRRHRNSLEWLDSQLDGADPAKTVIISHHAPHLNSIPEEYKEDILSCCYASDLTNYMGKAKLWIHGHVHESVDYELKGTRVLSNPRGYKLRSGKDQNPGFDMCFMLDV